MIDQDLILQTMSQFSGDSDEYLQIIGTDDCFLGVDEEKVVTFLLPSSINAHHDFSLPDKLQIEFISGKISHSSRNTWLKISFPEDSIGYFLNFVIHCLIELDENSPLSELKSIIFSWKKHWMFGRNHMTYEERIGLFGELVMLNHALQANKPMDWKSWQGFGINPGLHDFSTQELRVEVKTTSRFLQPTMHVFDARQFFFLPGTHLCVIRIEEDQSGDNVFDLCEDLTRTLRALGVSGQPISVVDQIQRKNSDFQHERYRVSSAGYYRLEPNGPFIQEEDFERRSVMNLSYEVNLESIPLIWDTGISDVYERIFD